MGQVGRAGRAWTFASSRRGTLRAAAVFAAVPTLAACGGAGAGDARPAEHRAARSVPLTIWARGASDKAVFDQIAGVVAAQAPHLAANTEIAEGLNDKLVVALAGGGAPDLAVVNMPFGVPTMGQGAFGSLQSYLAKDKATEQELKSFAPPALQAYRHKNELYAIPITNETIVLWYNADLLRQAGLTPPAEIEHDPQKWNWETLLDYAHKLNRGREQTREAFGLWVGSGIQASWGNHVYSNGGRILDETGSRMVLSDPAAAEGVQWCVDAIWRHDLAPQPATTKAEPNRVLFASGRLAMVWDGEFFRRYLFGAQTPQGVPFKFDLAQIPFAPRTRKRANVFHTLGLPILRPSKVPEGAWDYLRVFATKEAQQFITDGWGSRGGNQKTYEPWLKSNAGGGPAANYAAIVKSDAHGMVYPASPFLPSNDLTEPLNRLMPAIFENQVPVRSGLQQIDQETNVKLEPAAKKSGSR